MSRRHSVKTVKRQTSVLLLDDFALHTYNRNVNVKQLERLATLSILTNKLDEQDVEFGNRSPVHITSQRGNY